MSPSSDPETPAEHLRHAISDALRHLDREAEHVGDKRFAGVARAILRGQTATLARLAEAERKHGELHDELAAEFTDRMVAEARAEAAEKRLREAEEWIQEVDHVEDCAAFDRGSSRECDCGRTAILQREGA